MKNNRHWIFLGLMGAIALVGCKNQTDVDKLKEKRAELKSELAGIDEQIRVLDTNKTVSLPLVQVEPARIDQFKHEVIVQGQVKTDQEVIINAESSGIVQSIEVREGDYVKKGQVLAKIDNELLTSNTQEVETALEFAEYAYEKQTELFEKGVGTEFELKQAKSQVDHLKSQLNTIQTQKSKASVKAPFNGYIDELFTRKGEMASPQTPLFRLVNNEKVRISADISEHYYTRVEVGSPVKAYVPTLNDTMDLKVTAVGNYIHPTNRTFRIQSDVASNQKLLPNMLVQLHVTDQIIDSVLIVPSSALQKSQENEDYLFILNKNEENYIVERINIKIVSRHKGSAAIQPITRAIDADEKVATAGSRGVTHGDRVRIF